MKLGPAFEHVGGIAVAQGVGGDFVVLLTETAFDRGELDGVPDARFGHVMSGVVKGLPDGDAGRFPAAPDAGKEPVLVAMVFPKTAKAFEHLRGDGDFAGLAAFAMTDANDEPRGVDVLGSQRKGFAEAQSGVIDEGEVGSVAAIAKGAEEPGHFLASENVRERFLAFDFDLGPDLPAEPEVVAVEGAQGADGLIDRGASEVALSLKVEEEV